MPRTAFRDTGKRPADGEPIGDAAIDYSLFDNPVGQSAEPSNSQAAAVASIAGVSFDAGRGYKCASIADSQIAALLIQLWREWRAGVRWWRQTKVLLWGP